MTGENPTPDRVLDAVREALDVRMSDMAVLDDLNARNRSTGVDVRSDS